MNTVVIRRDRIQIDTPRGPTRSYSSGGARCLAYLVVRPGLVHAVLPLLQDTDPILASMLSELIEDDYGSRALARALHGAADQLLAAERVQIAE